MGGNSKKMSEQGVRSYTIIEKQSSIFKESMKDAELQFEKLVQNKARGMPTRLDF